jgi:hypothetical protein
VGHAFDVRFVCSNAERTLLTEHHRGDLPGVDEQRSSTAPGIELGATRDVVETAVDTCRSYSFSH